MSAVQLNVTALEERCTPVVGSVALANPVLPGMGLDGVVAVSMLGADGNLRVGTGTLLSSGRHILTAAHLLDATGSGQASAPVTVRFDLPAGSVSQTVSVANVFIDPDWPGLNGSQTTYAGHDLAVLTLPELAPNAAERYPLYRGSDELGQTFTVIGYGLTGTGTTGAQPGSATGKRSGQNRFDSVSAVAPGVNLMPVGQGLLADFDAGTAPHDTLGQGWGTPDLGVGSSEAGIAPGDSGGPALLRTSTGYRVAGIAAVYTSPTNTFGDILGYTRVSVFASLIDGITGGDPVPTLPALPAEQTIAVGADAGSAPRVQTFALDGTPRLDRLAFAPGQTGGVRVALLDQPTGSADLVAVAGPGGPTEVVVFVGTTGVERARFAAFPTDFTGGLFVATGDFDGDGTADIAVAPDQGGGPRVRVFSGATVNANAPPTVLADFWGIADPAFRGGARLAAGTVNADGYADLIVGAGYGGGPRLAVFDGRSLHPHATPTRLVSDFFAFEPGLRNGVYVAAGDVTGDGWAEIVCGAGPGGGPRVLALTRFGQPVSNFFAGDVTSRNGVRVAVKAGWLLTAPAPGAAAEISRYPLASVPIDGPPSTVETLSVLDGSWAGVFVG
jgi:hypothetical protein